MPDEVVHRDVRQVPSGLSPNAPGIAILVAVIFGSRRVAAAIDGPEAGERVAVIKRDHILGGPVGAIGGRVDAEAEAQVVCGFEQELEARAARVLIVEFAARSQIVDIASMGADAATCAQSRRAVRQWDIQNRCRIAAIVIANRAL